MPEGTSVNKDGQIFQNTAGSTETGNSTAISNSAGSATTGSTATKSSSADSTGTDSGASGRSLSEYKESGESGEFLEGLGEDYGSTEEEQAYIEAQKARRTGINKPVEYDH